jgi:hypothetical protein
MRLNIDHTEKERMRLMYVKGTLDTFKQFTDFLEIDFEDVNLDDDQDYKKFLKNVLHTYSELLEELKDKIERV